MSGHVLIADDEALIRQSLRTALTQEGFAVATAACGAEALARLQEERPDVVVLDLVLGDMDGLAVLERLAADVPEAKVLVITAHGSIETAVAAMKLGAYDFIRKPFELEEVIAAVRNALRTSALERRVEYLSARDRQRGDAGRLIFCSAVMQRAVDEAVLIAQSPVPNVLVVGESGTGKQVIARLLHDRSPRASGPFVELNCSAIPENLVESELFGHERGAFSDAHERKLGLVEVADGGTLLLDEVGDLGPGAQAKLLTFLEQRAFRRLGAVSPRRVDVRIVAATNRDLAAMVAERTFREDLWYRLNAMTVRLPALRERREDVAPLAAHFLGEAAAEFRRRWRGIAPEALGLLERYDWPGNVRELKAVIGRAALLHDDEALRPQHLPPEIVAAALAAATAPAAAPGAPRAAIPTLAEVELAHIRRVLELCGGNRTAAAQHLGITRQTLAKRIGAAEEE
ncbi:MAG TPA: sigma-54 dependent transcriptional regulator [Polyangia bacterium]|jgi:DNA-binding NtrC family response regulator